jgi:hypothetical protein
MHACLHACRFAVLCSLRYLVADSWPASERPPDVLTEEQVVGAALEDIIR